MPSEADRTIRARSIHDAGEISASDVLYQDAPEKHPGLRLEDMEAKLKTTTSPILKKFLETQIARLKQEKREIGEPARPPVLGMPGKKVAAKLDPAEQAKMRQQLIERGQMVSQEIPYDGFTIHFGVVPVTDVIEDKLDRIHQGIAVAKRELLNQGKKGLAERIAAFEATYTKAFLERSRIHEAIQLAKRALAVGWHVLFFSELTSEEVFLHSIEVNGEPFLYRELDEVSGGAMTRIMPELPNVMERLRAEFGNKVGYYSGTESTEAQRERVKEAFQKGDKPLVYTSYAAGGVSVNLHDTEGDKPRVSIFLGPPRSGVLLEKALCETWQLGVKSNTRAVILATDSETDIRLMATVIGPRLKARKASVLGERDSLPAYLAGCTDEQLMCACQDALAFDQGDEVRVNAQGFQVRSKSKVNFDNWSAITFPSAAGAMNNKIELSGASKEHHWVTRFQEEPLRWEPPNRPLTLEDLRIRRAMNKAAENAERATVHPPNGNPVQSDSTNNERTLVALPTSLSGRRATGVSEKSNLNLPNGGDPVSEAGTRQKARGTMRGYRWGKFQGWATFVIGLIAWAPAIWSFPGLVEWLAEIAVGATLMLLGIGLVHKRRFALVLLYAMLPILILGFALLNMPRFEVAFAVCWYFIPAILYYPKRWKEFSHGSGAAMRDQPGLLSAYGKQSAARQKREDLIKVDPAPKRQGQTKYLPDLGKYLASKGVQQNTALVYNSWEMDDLAVRGRGHYCTTRVQPLDGNLYCATFDFGDGILKEILARATWETEAAVLGNISNDPESPRHIPISIPIDTGVVAVLGNLEQGLIETFIPLQITEVFGLRRISSYVQEAEDNDP